ncbi:uncharacterized protein K441DRAFT_686759 [Cenococcum geophilum 1.58]|uniref:uncharacterized protein n=1 Tax=Cenococcum geophilum 1.58 TaxID=794803 RepID=UPI00358E1C33|nr:hypothetical protein K441DRAFT_686759 [Cenococcum geophilum 1.58]
MSWFSRSGSSSHRPSYARSYAGSSHSSHGRSSSHYKRRPRDGYIQRMIYKFKHLLRKLYDYARRHPIKVFFMVIMPLISGGLLHKAAKQLGIRLPDVLKGSGGASRGGGGYYGSEGYGKEESSGIGKLAAGIGGLGSVAKLAQAFM